MVHRLKNKILFSSGTGVRSSRSLAFMPNSPGAGGCQRTLTLNTGVSGIRAHPHFQPPHLPAQTPRDDMPQLQRV
eukprot:171305-Prymnesium_polylepis.1